MSELEVTQLISQLEAFPRPEEKAQRQRLWEALRSFSARVEDESTIQHRIISAPLEIVVARIANDLNIFDILLKSPEPVSVRELAAQTKADEILLARILRYLTAYFHITSPRPSYFAPSPSTATLASPGFAAGGRFIIDAIAPALFAAPSFLASTAYANPRSPTDTPFQRAHSTPDAVFTWLAGQPGVAADFNAFMAASHAALPSAFDAIPPHELLPAALLSNGDPERVVFVDVGGGVGRSLAELRAAHPRLVGRLVNQDLSAGAVAGGLAVQGAEHVVHDFFAEQPVRGAPAYYLRRVLHDWSDAECVEIVRRIAQAMGADSRLLIDEIVLRDDRPSWFASYADLSMMICFGAGERSRAGFEAICAEAGLEIRDDFRYVEDSGETVLVAVKA